MKRWKDKVVWFSTKEANKTLMYLFFSVVMATALFMTTSRGGIMSFLGALAVLYFTCLISAEAKKRNRILMASALVVLLMVIMFAWVGPEATIGRFQALQVIIKAFISERAILSEIRPFFWQDTMNMIKDFPAIGVGLGDYSYIFPKYRTFAEHWGSLQFAHNDYIQLIAEMGAVGGVFLVGFMVWYIRKFRRCIRGLRGNG
jgi:O-antigen ligase